MYLENIWKYEIDNMKVKCSKSCCWSCFLCYDIGYVVFEEVRYCKRNRERDGDVFMNSKMMIFQNNGVWERWVMDNGVWER